MVKTNKEQKSLLSELVSLRAKRSNLIFRRLFRHFVPRNDTLLVFQKHSFAGRLQLCIKAQATLEIALSLICVFILLFGSLNVFLWIHKKLVHSQEDYEGSRIEAGHDQPGKQIDYTNKTRYPELNILSETN